MHARTHARTHPHSHGWRHKQIEALESQPGRGRDEVEETVEETDRTQQQIQWLTSEVCAPARVCVWVWEIVYAYVCMHVTARTHVKIHVYIVAACDQAASGTRRHHSEPLAPA